MSSPEVVRALRDMEPGSHTVVIYDSPQNKRDVLFSHLTLGKSNSKMVYVCSEERPDEIGREMSAYGLDVADLAKRDMLVISNFDEVYIPKDGRVDIKGIINGFSRLAWDCRSKSLTLRAAAEMSCFFRKGKLVELVEYERALGKSFNFPGMGVCGYDVLEMQSSGALNTLLPIIRAHGRVIFTGPNGSVVMEPERVENDHVEQVMQIRMR